jgi:adenylate kinase
MQVILLGPPGVGKGTQAARIASEFGIAHISTGDMFREAVAAGTELGKTAREYMAAGALVPDEIVIGMVEERLGRPDTQKGFLLDGFPRTIPQAEALERLLEKLGRPVTAVVDLVADEELLISRLSGRRVCALCGATYHVENNPPRVEGVCDVCGGEVRQREDDRPEAIRERLREYSSKTAALTEHYSRAGLLESVAASGTPQEVFDLVREALIRRAGVGTHQVAG